MMKFKKQFLLDCYSAHSTKEEKQLAIIYNIELIFIPENGTDLYQPLYKYIFGMAKSKLRSFQNVVFTQEKTGMQ